ncbi:ABC transporter ATP-binding protein [Bosea sp. (in: a-proteobacteria)]|uniref:ABC transporter ATP-binding protein n=1 Tax=Bosea sp. (in: a-proteobacteria) TaxID=1871050 RepID=UPI0026361785|nr:ABC transporter ATP-binding protein [Bosea sp. (in: a-proteobacteria)]MCO5090369.1 ABC transporter ATP-binding protein [Bosea sp. (in: a-proteobacteria)]
MKASGDAGTELRLIGLKKSYGTAPAVRGISLDVAAGTIMSLIGPSGCGKTTTLRMIAGLEKPNEGQIVAGGRLLTDGPKGAPPEQRDLGMVFQTYALWPHMTVTQNVAYGLKQRKRPSAEIAGKVAEVLAITGMAQYAQRYPGQLSGGQQQRVALARAIATEPSILLFDEPLSNLDAVLREQMRFEIRALQQRLGITSVYVTHSQDEALALSDEIAVMQDGVIVQRGPPLAIYEKPRNAFVAGFIGLANILTLADAAARGDGVGGRLAGGDALLSATGGESLKGRGDARICIRPVDIRLEPGTAAPSGAANVIAGEVRSMSFTGGLVDYFVATAGGHDIRVQATPPIIAQAGTKVVLTVPPERIAILED